MAEPRKSRPVSWVKAALNEFEKFPDGAQSICLTTLTIAAEGGKADIAKPLHGLGSGVLEIALPFKRDAYRVIYATCSLRRKSGSFMRSRRNRRKASRLPSVRLT